MSTEKRIKILTGSEVLEFDSTPIFTANDPRFFFALDDRETRGIELKNCHGLRHAYAQTRYKELTGLEAPINGGPSKKQMNFLQKNKAQLARKIISNELGHSRIAITKVYLG
jgi:hypothetical protein